MNTDRAGLVVMLRSLPTVAALHILAVTAGQTTIYEAAAEEWSWIGSAERVARTSLRHVCPDIPETDTHDAIVSSSGADEIILKFQGGSIQVFGITFPSCDDDPVLASLLVGAPTASTSVPIFSPGPCVTPKPARCNVLLAEWDDLNAANTNQIALSARTTAIEAPIAIFYASVFSDGNPDGSNGRITSDSASGVTETRTLSSPSTSPTSSESGSNTRLARIIVPSIVVPLALLAALAFGAWWTMRRRNHTSTLRKGELDPYLDISPRPYSASQAEKPTSRVNEKLAAQTAATRSGTTPPPPVFSDAVDDPPLEEIRKAMHRAGFTPRALLASLNRVHARAADDAPAEAPLAEPSPPKYVV